jgi:hypothetical protein
MVLQAKVIWETYVSMGGQYTETGCEELDEIQ